VGTTPRDSSHMWVYGLLWCANLKVHASPFLPPSRFKLQELFGITRYSDMICRRVLPISRNEASMARKERTTWL
jgi:hypothetical protein